MLASTRYAEQKEKLDVNLDFFFFVLKNSSQRQTEFFLHKNLVLLSSGKLKWKYCCNLLY